MQSLVSPNHDRQVRCKARPVCKQHLPPEQVANQRDTTPGFVPDAPAGWQEARLRSWAVWSDELDKGAALYFQRPRHLIGRHLRIKAVSHVMWQT